MLLLFHFSCIFVYRCESLEGLHGGGVHGARRYQRSSARARPTTYRQGDAPDPRGGCRLSPACVGVSTFNERTPDPGKLLTVRKVSTAASGSLIARLLWPVDLMAQRLVPHRVHAPHKEGCSYLRTPNPTT